MLRGRKSQNIEKKETHRTFIRKETKSQNIRNNDNQRTQDRWFEI